MAKWAVELNEFKIQFAPNTTIKVDNIGNDLTTSMETPMEAMPKEIPPIWGTLYPHILI